MADNLGTPGGASGPVATDDIGGIHFQRIKLIHGADGVNAGDVSTANRFPVEDTSSSVVGSGVQATAQRVTIATDNAVIGATNETAASSDTATAGLNGRLQRIAQNITSLLTLTGAVGETAPANDTSSSGLNGRLQRIAQRVTSLIALLPTSLGQKTAANSLAVTVASDQSAIPVTVSASKISVTKINGTTVGAQATPYSAGDLIGTKLTLTGVLGANETAVVSAVVLRTNGLTTNGGFALYLFDANPSSTTFTDGAAFDIDPADIEKVVAILGFPAANFYGGTSEKASLNAPNILMVSTVSGGTLYGAIVASASCEWGAINEGLAVTFTAETF